MKCIKCGTDNDLSQRTSNQGQCVKCNHSFTFEPRSNQPGNFTDKAFQDIIANISANETLFYTQKQFLYLLNKPKITYDFKSIKNLGTIYLFFTACVICMAVYGAYIISVELLKSNFYAVHYYVPFFVHYSVPFALTVYNLLFIYYLFNQSNSSKMSFSERRIWVNYLLNFGIFTLAVGGYYSISLHSALFYWIVAALGLLAFWLSVFQRKRLRDIPIEFTIKAEKMHEYLDNWARANGSPKMLLSSLNNILTKDSEATDSPAGSQNSTLEQDVAAYSFDRVVICERDEIAQMLIANNFHFENNCAILSVSGYPHRIFTTTMQMLRRNPGLKVYAFHDCSPNGMILADYLRTNSEWFPDSNINIFDVGLSPRQVVATKLDVFLQRSSFCAQCAKELSNATRQNLSIEELKWLESGNFVELESFSPKKLIQVLHYSINNNQQILSERSLADQNNYLFLVDDYNMNIFTSDSFG